MSDSPTSPSGFGNVSRFVCAGLAQRGYDVHILGWQNVGAVSTWNGCRVYPVRQDGFGADVLLEYLTRIRPDALIALADVWWLTFVRHPGIEKYLRASLTPWLLYFPIDSDLGDRRLPPSWVRILEAVDVPIAMSAYGRDVALANGVRARYIPHGVDTGIFRPPADRSTAKAALGYADRFVILCDARNQPRKMLPRLLEVFRRFARVRPDALLHLHTDPDDSMSRAAEYRYDLRGDIAALGLADAVRFTPGFSMNPGVSLETLAAVYQAADVHLLLSRSEGFGLPTLQAAAAGAVPMAAAYAASAELVAGHGVPLPVQHWVQNEFGLLQAFVDIDRTVDALIRLHDDVPLRQSMAAASVTFAQPYSWDRVNPLWDQLLRREVPLFRRAPGPPRVGQVRRLEMRGGLPSHDPATVAVGTLPAGVSVTLEVRSLPLGELEGPLMHTDYRPEQSLGIPARPPRGPIVERVSGRILGTGLAAIRVFERLRAVLPSLTMHVVHASPPGRTPSDAVGGQVVIDGVTAVTTDDLDGEIAASVLVLHVNDADALAGVPERAARVRTPCVAWRSLCGGQWRLLAVSDGDEEQLFARARRVLVDHSVMLSALDALVAAGDT